MREICGKTRVLCLASQLGDLHLSAFVLGVAIVGLSGCSSDSTTQAPTDVRYEVPAGGGTVRVSTSSGNVLSFEFPATGAGKVLTLKSESSESIGWGSGQFVDVIEMGPDGTTFEPPVRVKSSGSGVVALSMRTSKTRSKPELLPIGQGGVWELSHFSSLAIAPLSNTCETTTTWTPTVSAPECTAFGLATKKLAVSCDAYCWHIQASCCVDPAAPERCTLLSPGISLLVTQAMGALPSWCDGAPTTDGGFDGATALDAGATDSSIVDSAVRDVSNESRSVVDSAAYDVTLLPDNVTQPPSDVLQPPEDASDDVLFTAPDGGGGDDSAASADANGSDSAADAPADVISGEVTVLAKAGSGVNAKLANVTLLAYRDGATGTWAPVNPSSTGQYRFTPTQQTYWVASVCSPGNGGRVAIYQRPSSVRSILTSADGCSSSSGTTQSTTTLHFSGFTAQPGYWAWAGWDGNRFNIYSDTNTMFPTYGEGAWIFGLAASASAPISILRIFDNVVIDSTNTSFDVDMSTNAVALETSTLAVQNVVSSASPSVRYGLADMFGIVMLKITQEVLTTSSNTLTYAAVPSASRRAGDWMLASASEGGRSIEYRSASDLPAAIALPAALGAVSPYVAAQSPYPQYGLEIAPYDGATEYSAYWSASDGQKGGVTWLWTMSVVPQGATPASYELAMPDLSVVAGWQAAWQMPAQYVPTGSCTAIRVQSAPPNTVTESATKSVTYP